MMEECLVGEGSNSRRLSKGGWLERQLDLEQVADQGLVGEAVADANPGQAVDFGKRAQGNDVVIPIVHGVGITGVIAGVLEISLVQDDQRALGDVPVEIIELGASEDRSGGIIGIREVYDLCPLGDCVGKRGQVV